MDIRESEEFLEMSDGFKLFARRWMPIGESEKIVVSIHGFGGHSGYLSPIGRSLAAGGVEVYALDLRGFGNSKEPDLPRGDTRDFRRHLQDLNETVNILRNSSRSKKLFMLGHSLGGLYVLWYGAKYPDSSDGLIILAPSIEVKQKLKRPSDPERFKFLLANAPETMMESIKGPALEDEESLRLSDPLVQLRARSFSIRYIAGIGSVLMREKVFLNAAEVKKPTLILQGDADGEALPTGAKRLLESLAASDKLLTMVPGAQHSLYGAISGLKEEDDPAKKELVFLTIKDWIEAH